jgi:hypothetical protein
MACSATRHGQPYAVHRQLDVFCIYMLSCVCDDNHYLLAAQVPIFSRDS